MRIIRTIRTKAAVIAAMISTGIGAFLLPVMPVFASDGNGAVYVDVPIGWQNRERTLQIKVEDYVRYDKDNKEIPVTAKRVYAGFDNGEYEEITDSMVVTIDHNCTLRLKAIYTDGNVVSNVIKIENFDLIRPQIGATVEGEILYLEASDDLSGVADICVNGKAYTELKDNKMCVNIKDLEATDEYISLHSDDEAGNSSKEYKIKNPYYVGEIESGQEDKSLDNPDSIEPSDPTEARGTVTDDFITQGREFFTVDASGKTFYLIVDRTQNQENVYLLTEAGVNDLLNFTDYNGVDVQNGDIPMYEFPSNAYVTTETEPDVLAEQPEEKTSDKKVEEKNNSMTMIVVVVVVCVAGIGYYFVKKKKRDEDLDGAEDMSNFIAPDDAVIPEGQTEYEGEDESQSSNDDNNQIPANAHEVEYHDESEMAGADIMPGDLVEDIEGNTDKEDPSRMLAYFNKN